MFNKKKNQNLFKHLDPLVCLKIMILLSKIWTHLNLPNSQKVNTVGRNIGCRDKVDSHIHSAYFKEKSELSLQQLKKLQ